MSECSKEVIELRKQLIEACKLLRIGANLVNKDEPTDEDLNSLSHFVKYSYRFLDEVGM